MVARTNSYTGKRASTMNHDFSTAETLDLLLCRACGAEARTHDRFCRRCGATHLWGKLCQSTTIEDPALPLGQRYTTARLAPVSPYHGVSGSLVNAIVTGVLANSAVYQT